MIYYRLANSSDIEGIIELQSKYHIDTISDLDKVDGFVTTLFNREQIKKLIDDSQNALVLALKNNKIIGYAMNAHWDYWVQWDFFKHMVKELPNITVNDVKATRSNSFQYGPVCIEVELRGKGVLNELFVRSYEAMKENYPLMLTFINHQNPRSYHAHVRKLGLSVLKSFEYNGNIYYFLSYTELC